MAVVSAAPMDRSRDYEAKLAEYAQAGIPEYWIVDAERWLVTVNRLEEGRYVRHGEFTPGAEATSVLLPGFAIDVAALFGEIDGLPR